MVAGLAGYFKVLFIHLTIIVCYIFLLWHVLVYTGPPWLVLYTFQPVALSVSLLYSIARFRVFTVRCVCSVLVPLALKQSNRANQRRMLQEATNRRIKRELQHLHWHWVRWGKARQGVETNSTQFAWINKIGAFRSRKVWNKLIYGLTALDNGG